MPHLAKYKRNKDGYFRETFTIPGAKTKAGKQKRVTVRDRDLSVFKLKVEEARRLYGLGLSLEGETVREWGERWLAVYKANASATQRDHYEARLEKDILPSIGNMKVRDVRASHLQELLNKFAGGRVGTVKKVKIAIAQLFADAEIEGLIERNPAVRLELPEMEERCRRPLTKIERIAIYTVAQCHKAGAYVLTMLFCGLRRGECAALLVGDVDLKSRKLTVSKSLSLRKNVGVVEGTKASKLRQKVKGKADDGCRVVPIPELLAPFLAKACENRKPDEVLFAKSDGKAATKTTCHWWWRSFVRQCHISAGAKLYRNAIQYETSPFGKEVTPHYLRHTYSTDLYAAGVDDKAQKTFLGHASGDVTDIYRKMSEAAFERSRGLINEYLPTQCLTPGRPIESLKYCVGCCIVEEESAKK